MCTISHKTLTSFYARPFALFTSNLTHSWERTGMCRQRVNLVIVDMTGNNSPNYNEYFFSPDATITGLVTAILSNSTPRMLTINLVNKDVGKGRTDQEGALGGNLQLMLALEPF